MLPSLNDLLAAAMASTARVSTYNVGIDKSYAASAHAWPEAIKRAVTGIGTLHGLRNRIAAVLQDDATVVVICFFGLYTGARSWPAPSPNVVGLRTEVANLAHDSRLTVSRGALMATVRLQGTQ
jgi:hypothetical protein